MIDDSNQIPVTSCSGRVWFLVGKVFSRSSPRSGAAGPSEVRLPVEAVTTVTGVMEAELVEGMGTVDAAAAMENGCRSDMLLGRPPAGSVALMR